MKNLALLLIAVVVGALAAEGAVRLAGFKPRTAEVNPFFVPGETSWSMPDPDLGWINKPGVSRAIGGDVRMTFWDHGRRATHPTSTQNPAPLPGGIPVMIIGGSNAQSYGVADQDTFAWRLAARDPKLRIENFGNGGYGTVQAMMLAERELGDFYKDVKPRIILLAFDDAHILRNVSDQSWIFSISDFAGRYAAPPHYRLKNGALEFHPYRSIGFWPLETHSAALTLLHNVWLQTFAYNTKGQAMAVTREVIARLAALAKANDALFAVAVLEDRGEITPALFRDAAFPHVDCSAPGRADRNATYIAANGHPNPALHAYFTECIGAWLDKDVLPKLESAP